MGYLTPLYFAAAILLIVDKLPMLAHWPDLDLVVPRKINLPMYFGMLLEVSWCCFPQGYLPCSYKCQKLLYM